MIPRILAFIDHYVLTLSALGKFAIILVMLIVIPRLCRRARVPSAVGLLLGGAIVGPYVAGQLLALHWTHQQLFFASAIPALISAIVMAATHWVVQPKAVAGTTAEALVH